ncbi:hypothetical protein CQ054_17355 [Ochrobactrum sp. MYb29]|nr:hypothetical protein CWE02_05695 [Brucella pituitosa]PRA84191.1 hypothetical protein CQ054_17355 [Ochrobactrum sp. MYb29]
MQALFQDAPTVHAGIGPGYALFSEPRVTQENEEPLKSAAMEELDSNPGMKVTVTRPIAR